MRPAGRSTPVFKGSWRGDILGGRHRCGVDVSAVEAVTHIHTRTLAPIYKAGPWPQRPSLSWGLPDVVFATELLAWILVISGRTLAMNRAAVSDTSIHAPTHTHEAKGSANRPLAFIFGGNLDHSTVFHQ